MKRWVTVVAVLVLAGCSAPVAGEPVSGGTTTTTTTTTESTEDTTTDRPTTTEDDEPSLDAPPTAIDPAAPAQYCDGTITGALGKPMQVVVVETPGGRVNCDQAGAVLVDYYGERPNPDPGSEPIEVAGFACDQVPAPDMPQVICADGTSLFYSMWVQGG
jgi:hypothetical protein